MLRPPLDQSTQFRWLEAEVEYAHAKTKGHDEKLRRLRLPVDDPESVMKFMSSYWNRFRMFGRALEETGDPRAAQQALQQIGKVAGGMVTKVGIALDRMDYKAGPTEMINVVKRYAIPGPGPGHIFEKILYPNGVTEALYQDFGQTEMGKDVRILHRWAHALPDSREGVRTIHNSLDISARGTLGCMMIWQAYSDHLAALGIDNTMPKPGVPSGQIEVW